MEEHLLYPGHPKFEPKKWNKKYVLKSHNCYAYAMNTIKKRFVKTCKKFNKLSNHQKTLKKSKLRKKLINIYDNWDWEKLHPKEEICPYVRPQVGAFSKTVKKLYRSLIDVNSKNIEKMLLKDNPKIKKIKITDKCPLGYYRIYLYTWKNNEKKKGDYHFLRQDNTGLWSHKNGVGKAYLLRITPEKYIENIKDKNKRKKRKTIIDVCGYYAVPIKGRRNLGSLYFI